MQKQTHFCHITCSFASKLPQWLCQLKAPFRTEWICSVPRNGQSNCGIAGFSEFISALCTPCSGLLLSPSGLFFFFFGLGKSGRKKWVMCQFTVGEPEASHCGCPTGGRTAPSVPAASVHPGKGISRPAPGLQAIPLSGREGSSPCLLVPPELQGGPGQGNQRGYQHWRHTAAWRPVEGQRIQR